MFIGPSHSNGRGAYRIENRLPPTVPLFVFTDSLPGNALIQSAILLLRTCFEVSVAQRFLHEVNTPQYFMDIASFLKKSTTMGATRKRYFLDVRRQ
jgi:hypothetical protein